MTRCLIFFILNSATGKKIPRVAQPPPPPPHSSAAPARRDALMVARDASYIIAIFFFFHRTRFDLKTDPTRHRSNWIALGFYSFFFVRPFISEQHRYASRNKRERSNYLKTISSPPSTVVATPRQLVADAATTENRRVMSAAR